MTMRETTIAKLQQLPEPLLQRVSDFIDRLTYTRQHSTANGKPEGDVAQAWVTWLEAVDRLDVSPTEPTGDYQELLFTKYRQQGLEL